MFNLSPIFSLYLLFLCISIYNYLSVSHCIYLYFHLSIYFQFISLLVSIIVYFSFFILLSPSLISSLLHFCLHFCFEVLPPHLGGTSKSYGEELNDSSTASHGGKVYLVLFLSFTVSLPFLLDV